MAFISVRIYRDDEKSGHYRMSPRTPLDSHTGADTVSTAGESIRPRVGDVQARAFEFNPPAMIRWYTLTKDQVGASFLQQCLISFEAFTLVYKVTKSAH